MDLDWEQEKLKKLNSIFSSTITFNHSGYIDCVKISPDSKHIVYNCDKSILFRDASTLKLVDTLKDHSKFVSSICFNSKYIFSSAQGEIFQYEQKERKLANKFKIGTKEKALNMSANDKYLVFYGCSRVICFDLKENKEIYSQKHKDNAVLGNGVVCISGDEEDEFFLSNDFERFSRFNFKEEKNIYRKFSIFPTAMTLEKENHFFWGGPLGNIYYYDREKDKQFSLKPKHADLVSSISFKGNILISGSIDKHIYLWNYIFGKQPKFIEEVKQDSSIIAVDIIPEQYIVVGLKNRTLKILKFKNSVEGRIQRVLYNNGFVDFNFNFESL
eukprot:gene8936-885_t